MLVETYELQEVVSITPEQTKECRELIEKLGLDGQQTFYNAPEQQVCPYRKMTAQEGIVYRALLDKETPIESYADGPIPVRVLQVGMHAKSVLPCELVVLHPSNADVKDPLLLGKVKKSSYEYEYYLLARWGDVLEEFSVLQDYAKKIIAAKLRGQWMKVKNEVEVFSGQFEVLAEEAVLTGKSKSFWFSAN